MLDDDNQDEHSVTELRLLSLVETAPGMYRAGDRIDWIYHHNLVVGDHR